jgi:carboxypeptidase Q
MKALLLFAAALPSFAFAQTLDPAALRDAALSDTLAYEIVEGLTTEIGPRLGGTPAEAQARDWAVIKLKALGFSNVRIEPFMVKGWVRGVETGVIEGANPRKLAITALGNSGATRPQGLSAEIVMFDGLAALKAAPEGRLKGKIAFVTHRMNRTQDGSSYGAFGPIRFVGPSIAAQKGAAAIVIRSAGTDYHRNPHTGTTNFAKDVTPIPAAAVSIPDAELIERLAKRGPVRLTITLTPRATGPSPSGNVIADIPGSDPSAGIVLIGGHLDSWDLGQGAIDDAAGVAITTAAAKRILDSGKQPRRTIRVVWFGSEEIGGGIDGDAYQAAHKGEPHAFAAESDFGADRIWQFVVKLPDTAKSVTDRLAAALAPLGIAVGIGEVDGGADVEETIKAGASGIDLRQDGNRYFDLHHTPDDTLDKIDPAQLRQNVAAWTAMLAIVADAPENFGQTTLKK